MKKETIKFHQRVVSCVSESMAEHFKNEITTEQYEILKHNTYTLEKEDEIYNSYRGCGCGWIEFDKTGKPIDLKYLNEEITKLDDDYAAYLVVLSKDHQSLMLKDGSSHANVDLLEFHTDQLIPTIFKNGNIRLLVNFSSYQLCRY